MEHPANKVRSIFQFPPKKPKTGWRVWREAHGISDLSGKWRIQLWIDGKLITEEVAAGSYSARRIIQVIMNSMDDETKKKIRLHEAFNEAEE